MKKDVSITLSNDEALVLFEFFARFEDSDELTVKHASEYVALSKISAQLDKSLEDMFAPDYSERLDNARKSVASGFEGAVPGMKN